MRKGLTITVLTALAAVLVGQRKDIERYIKIKRLSTGEGHPELVPAGGHQAYPQYSLESDLDHPTD